MYLALAGSDLVFAVLLHHQKRCTVAAVFASASFGAGSGGRSKAILCRRGSRGMASLYEGFSPIKKAAAMS